MHMPARKTTPKMQRRAAELRHIPTEAEARLWAHLRAHRMQGIHFRRQHAIGSYIVQVATCYIFKPILTPSLYRRKGRAGVG
jgi:very-short-patch-repair endonuclease